MLSPDATFLPATNSSARLPGHRCILIIRQRLVAKNGPRNYSVNYTAHGQLAEQAS